MPKTKEKPKTSKPVPAVERPCGTCGDEIGRFDNYTREDGPQGKEHHASCKSKEELDLGDTSHGQQGQVDGGGTLKKAPPAEVSKAAQAFVQTKDEYEMLKGRLETRKEDLQALMRKHDVPFVTAKGQFESYRISRSMGEEKLTVEKCG